jgi:1-acyl-sn-glycerol-3-phosphate acyltransferase
MSIKDLWYLFFKQIIKLGLFFYTKRIHVSGKNYIPKNEAVIFVPNHPNGLIDPLFVAANNPRINHFLVRAAVFKKLFVKKILNTLNLMPIYRIRDGKENMRNNEAIFQRCCNILLKKRSLMIFAEGSHDCKRTVRPLKTGFLKIAFATLQQNPKLKINIVPVGLTYQQVTNFPSELALHYGKPILANSFYNGADEKQFISSLNKKVSEQLKTLIVHIPKENYAETLEKLQQAQVDFTKVNEVNSMIASGEFLDQNTKNGKATFLKTLLIVNNLLPYVIWKKVSKKIEDIEFVDTFRFAVSIILFPLNLLLQTLLIAFLFGNNIGWCYSFFSILITLIYVKK